MLTADLRAILREIDGSFRALDITCRERDGNWRRDVVRLRRGVADEMGRMGVLVANVSAPSAALIAFRNALSQLRSAVAELQATWPAVSLDPDAPQYQQAVVRIRTGMLAIEKTLAACEHHHADAR